MELKGKPNRSFGSYKPSLTIFLCACYPRVGGVGVLPSNRLMGMCRWMGSHFRGWIDCNGVAFSIELLEWDLTFSGVGDQKIQVVTDLKIGRCLFQDDEVERLYKLDQSIKKSY